LKINGCSALRHSNSLPEGSAPSEHGKWSIVMWKFGIASIASLCVLTGGVAVPFVMADAPTTGPSTAPAGTDKITGKVVDQNNQPVANVTVNLFPAKASVKAAAKPADPTAVTPKQTADTPDQQAPGGRQKHAPPLATATTKDDGSFEFDGLADGKYQVAVRVKKVGQGRQTVTLDSSNPDQTITITLAPKKPKAAAAN
jgi:hypothetical protein